VLLKLEDKLLSLAKVFGLVDRKSMRLVEAAKLAGYSYWHLTRLYRRYRQVGVKRLLQPRRDRPPARISSQQMALLKELYVKLEKPQMSQLLYFFELDHPDFPSLSREWARQLLRCVSCALTPTVVARGARRRLLPAS